jgi:hypothetical protein
MSLVASVKDKALAVSVGSLENLDKSQESEGTSGNSRY